MIEPPRFRFLDLAVLFLLLAGAAAVRVWYVSTVTDHGAGPAPLHAQGQPLRVNFADEIAQLGKKEPDNLIANIKEDQSFTSLAPLADSAEETAHFAPGYPWLVALLTRWVDDPAGILRLIQCGLGTLTVAFYFFFARRAFHSRLVTWLAGLLCAINPFWIANTAELNDGVLTTTLLGAVVVLGTRGGQVGGAATSLLYGLGLAGLALVRAALLPFAIVGLLWFLLRCRRLRLGWLYALLAFLGFANGLAPWTVRNYQVFHEPIPIADSAFVHLWIGNNDRATGGPQNEETLRASLPPGRLAELQGQSNQAARYRILALDVCDSVQTDPAGTLRRRLWAGLSFFFGEAWLKNETAATVRPSLPAARAQGADTPALPEWLEHTYLGIINGSLLAMFVLGLLGWRWTFAWRRESRLATLAAIWIPLPYILGHAGTLWGPRLPLDGVLLCYMAFALAYLSPNTGGFLAHHYEKA
jgi:4-amino-4-deoxy-L-arabinose transferase-like glycosyltransferase